MTNALDEQSKNEAAKPSTTVAGTIQKIIRPSHPAKPEQAEVLVHDAEPLYQELRIENTLVNEKGEEVGLKPGAAVEMTIEADEKDTVKKT